MQTIMRNLDSSLCRDLQIYNARKSKYDTFWEIAAAKIKELTAVNDRRRAAASMGTRCVVVNMALYLSLIFVKNAVKRWRKLDQQPRKRRHFPDLSCNFCQTMLQHIQH